MAERSNLRESNLSIIALVGKADRSERQKAETIAWDGIDMSYMEAV
jgi:hypothetical protein